MNGAEKIIQQITTNSIMNLSFQRTEMDGAEMKKITEALKINQSVTTLTFDEEVVGKIGVKNLAESLKINQSITTLSIRKSIITDAELKELAEALKINQSVKELDLSFNWIGASGIKFITESLQMNQSVMTLNLGFNFLGDVGAKEISEALKINQSIINLKLNDNEIGYHGAKEIAEALKINQTITSLYLDFNQIGDDGTEELAEALKINRSITTLNVQENQIGDDGAKEIAEALKINQTLTILNLRGNQIGDVGVKEISEALKTNQSITALDLLESKMGGTGLIEISEALQTNQYLTSLFLNSNKIGSYGFKELAEALKSNHFISTFHLYFKEIGYSGAKNIADALKNNRFVKEFHLNGKLIKDGGLNEIARALKNNQSITTLYLNYNELGEAGAKDIADVLKINKFIKELYLQNNQIGSNGAKEIAEALKVNKAIKKLSLKSNLIKDNGAKEIAEALKINQSLTTLDLTLNKIGNAGAKNIAEAIKSNQYIVELYLDSNQIGNIGAKDIAKALQMNQSIKTLTVHNNQVSYTLMDNIKEFLKSNTTLAENSIDVPVSKLKHQEKLEEQEINELQGRDNIKVKQYLPNISNVKIFENLNLENLNDEESLAAIADITDLIRDGRDRLQVREKKGILLLGATRAGKSTLANLLNGKALKAVADIETNELVIDTMMPDEDIFIGHKLVSETKIPNKCSTKNISIWDFPGFNDTDPVQEIINIFYIKRISEITDKLKFVLVISELILNSDNKRSSIFLETLSCFIKCFNDIKSIKDSISLVVTHVPLNKNIQNIEKDIESILTSNQRATLEQKILINKFKEDKSIYLFYKPSAEGELTAKNLCTTPNLLATIDTSSNYSNVKSDNVNIAISNRAMNYAFHLLNTTSNNCNQILEVIVNAIGYPFQCVNKNLLNPFFQNYALIENWMPSSFHYKNFSIHEKSKYFSELELLLNLKKVLSRSVINVSDSVKILQKAVEVYAEYTDPGDKHLQHKIQEFGYCLQQQYEYVEFFANICEFALPNKERITNLISICHGNVITNFEYQITSLFIDKDKSSEEYYLKAIQYLDYFQDNYNCKKQKAIAYSCIANIAEKYGDQECQFVYSAKAINANNNSPKMYEELAQLFFKRGQYAKAIDYYKIVNNVFKVKECFKAWLKQDRENPHIMLKQAEFFESMCLFEHAEKYFYYAFSLSQDDNFRAMALKKINNIKNIVAQV